MQTTKQYLGDGVYCAPGSFDGEVVLTTEDGVSVQNAIILEPPVWGAFLRYLGHEPVVTQPAPDTIEEIKADAWDRGYDDGLCGNASLNNPYRKG